MAVSSRRLTTQDPSTRMSGNGAAAPAIILNQQKQRAAGATVTDQPPAES